MSRLTDLAVDSSALIAILAGEPEEAQFRQSLADADAVIISAATLHETYCVARRRLGNSGVARLDGMLNMVDPEIAPFDVGQLEAAKAAYAEFGRGSGHKAGLNMGDCFSYALAKTLDLPLLFKGDDFVHTDIQSALV